MPESDMFRAELEMFAESCRTGKANELTRAQRQRRASRWSMRRCARSSSKARRCAIADVIADAQSQIAEGQARHVA